MPGLSPYTRVLEAAPGPGNVQKITVRGSTIFLRRVMDFAQVLDLPNSIRVTAEVKDSGETYTVRMAASEKMFTAREYWEITIENDGPDPLFVEFYFGEGDFFRPVPDIVNVSVVLSAASNIVTYPDETAVDIGNAGAVEILAALPNRHKAIITALEANTDNIRIGDSTVDTDQGIQLQPGFTLAIETKGAIWACSETANGQGVSLAEEFN